MCAFLSCASFHPTRAFLFVCIHPHKQRKTDIFKQKVFQNTFSSIFCIILQLNVRSQNELPKTFKRQKKAVRNVAKKMIEKGKVAPETKLLKLHVPGPRDGPYPIWVLLGPQNMAGPGGIMRTGPTLGYNSKSNGSAISAGSGPPSIPAQKTVGQIFAFIT